MVDIRHSLLVYVGLVYSSPVGEWCDYIGHLNNEQINEWIDCCYLYEEGGKDSPD